MSKSLVRRTASTACVSVLVLCVSGCGDQSEEAKTSMSESFQTQDLGGMTVTEEQADCMAGDIVDGVGVDQLKEYGVLTEDGTVNDTIEEAELGAEDADTVASALVGCIGAENIVNEQVVQDAMTEDQKSCIVDAMGEDQLTALISAGFQGTGSEDEAVQQMQDDMAACMKPKKKN